MTYRTLITDGFGFVATWTAAGLLRKGHRVTLADNRPVAGTPADLAGLPDEPGVTVGHADVNRPGSLDHLGEFDYIVHAAALLDAATTWRGTAVAVDFATRNPALRRFLLLSGSATYGMRENNWLAVRGQDTAETLVSVQGLPFAIVRPSDVYGPLRTDDYTVGMFVRQALAGGPIIVPGTGAQTRSWCYVEDFVDGLIRCLCLPAAAGRTFTIGDARHELTITELALLVRELTGGGAPIVHVPQSGQEIQPRKPDLAVANDLLGYRPRYGIVEGLRATVDWLAAADQPWPMPGAGGRPGGTRLAS